MTYHFVGHSAMHRAWLLARRLAAGGGAASGSSFRRITPTLADAAEMGHSCWSSNGLGTCGAQPPSNFCVGRRGWASSSTGGDTFKAQLRNLYRLIHPDFFHDWPAEREENERSFALLQEYLSTVQEGAKGQAGSAGKGYHFIFYLRKAPHSVEAERPGSDSKQREGGEEDGEESREELLEGLFRVSVTLPPPQTGRGRHGAETSRLALGKLLRAVGLSPNLQAMNFDDDGRGGQSAKRPLQHILEENAEQVRRHESMARGVTAQMAMARTALRLGRRVVFSLSNTLEGLSPQTEVDLYLRFAATCDRLDELDLSQLKVVVGGAYGTDVSGAMWLDASSSADNWADWIRGNISYARQRQSAAAKLRAIESDVASSLGVRMLFTSQLLSRTEQYRQFLERAAVLGAQRGAIGGSSAPFRTVPLCAVRSDDGEGTTLGPFQVTPLGGLTFPVTAEVEAVVEFVARRGVEAVGILEAKAREEAALRALVDSTRKALRLRHLVRDKHLPQKRFESCCKRLLGYAPELAPVVEGMSICVSDSHGVTQDQSMVALAWDFHL